MFFQENVFTPEQIPDTRLRQALCAACEYSGEQIDACDLFEGVLRAGDERMMRVLSDALKPGQSLAQLLGDLERNRPLCAREKLPRWRTAFSASALAILDDLQAIFQLGLGPLVDGAGLEFFAHSTLSRIAEKDSRMLAAFDIKRVLARLQQEMGTTFARRLAAAWSGISTNQGAPTAGGQVEEKHGPFVLPPELAPSDDLTFRAQRASGLASYPFDGDAMYDRVFDAIVRVLHRRQGNHVFLTGERGVGKNTILVELARRAATGLIPFLKNKRFVLIDCRYVPPDESRQRMVAILTQVSGHPELIVCLDGLPSLLRADLGGGNRAAFLACISQARCQCIAMLSGLDYEELVSNDPEFDEFFNRVEVEEPNLDVAIKLLRHFSDSLAARYQVEIADEAVREAVILSADYILNDQLPAKALKILRRICEDIDFEKNQLGKSRSSVTSGDVFRAVSEISGVPEETLRGIAGRSDYEQSLREFIVGQEHAVREVATELGLIKAGMTDANKPASVMLFMGQTGTGKTEMAKVLARFYSTSKRLKTYTLGNCVEPHSVSTIIGVPPGYVGTDQGGRLINELNADPYCVFLLDEADKAHPDVLQPFLNLFDEGWVCDQRGVKAHANKSIFVLTTNVAQRMIAELVQQGKTMSEITERMKEALSQIKHSKSERPVFTAEFLARIKRIIVFKPLDLEAMSGISQRLIAELQRGWLTKRGKQLQVSESVISYIADHAHQSNDRSKGREGGRVVRKLIAELIEASLQREISLQPNEYKASAAIRIDFQRRGEDDHSTPTIEIRFVK
jgi:ATP-dependent Clp protease ATP-binding subunit ClpC